MRVISSDTATRSGAGSSRILRHQSVDAEPDGAAGVFRPGANEGFILFAEIVVELFRPMVERMNGLGRSEDEAASTEGRLHQPDLPD
jgi:hypothetical protein